MNTGTIIVYYYSRLIVERADSSTESRHRAAESRHISRAQRAAAERAVVAHTDRAEAEQQSREALASLLRLSRIVSNTIVLYDRLLS